MSPKSNVKQRRWRENSYVFQVGGVIFVAFVAEAFVGLKNATIQIDLSVVPRDLRECKLSSKIEYRGVPGNKYCSGGMTFSIRRVSYG